MVSHDEKSYPGFIKSSGRSAGVSASLKFHAPLSDMCRDDFVSIHGCLKRFLSAYSAAVSSYGMYVACEASLFIAKTAGFSQSLASALSIAGVPLHIRARETATENFTILFPILDPVFSILDFTLHHYCCFHIVLPVRRSCRNAGHSRKAAAAYSNITPRLQRHPATRIYPMGKTAFRPKASGHKSPCLFYDKEKRRQVSQFTKLKIKSVNTKNIVPQQRTLF